MAKKIKKQRTDIQILDNVATYSLSFNGAIQGLYMGQFKFRCYLSPMQNLSASREYRDLLGANTELATENDRFLAFALAQLKYRILEAPPFWNTVDGAGEIPDYDVITMVMEAAMDSEVMFRDKKKEEKERAIAQSKAAAEKILAMTTADRKKDEEE